MRLHERDDQPSVAYKHEKIYKRRSFSDTIIGKVCICSVRVSLINMIKVNKTCCGDR